MTEREFYNKMLGIPSPIIDTPSVTGRTGIINRPGTPSASDNTYNSGSRWESILGDREAVQNRRSTEPTAVISHSRSDYGNPLRNILPRTQTNSMVKADSGGTVGTNNVSASDIMVCYIINKLTGDTIVFNAYPADLNESYSAEFNPSAVMGRSSPYWSYSGNSARSISYQVVLLEDICPNMMSVVDQLRGLVYPNYAGSLVQPPYCYIKFGDMVSCSAIVDSVDFTWGETVLADNQHFSKVEVSLSYQELRLGSLPTSSGVFNEG